MILCSFPALFLSRLKMAEHFTPAQLQRQRKVIVDIAQKYVRTSKFTSGITKVVSRDNRGTATVLSALKIHVGQQTFDKLSRAAEEIVWKRLLRERVMVDASTTPSACCACFSYAAQITCRRCKKVCLCSGCHGYEYCQACDRADAH